MVCATGSIVKVGLFGDLSNFILALSLRTISPSKRAQSRGNRAEG